METAKQLWAGNEDLAEACLEHPFVQGIADGSLARTSFQIYVGQDAFFLEAFARAYALALAKSPDRAGMTQFKDLVLGVFDELTLHAAEETDDHGWTAVDWLHYIMGTTRPDRGDVDDMTAARTVLKRPANADTGRDDIKLAALNAVA